MIPKITWTGEAAGVLDAVLGALPNAEAMPQATAAPGQPANLLINLIQDAQAAIDAASRFAAWEAAPASDRLVVTIIPPSNPADWEGTRQAALLWAFTRHAALAWAPRRIRVNAIGLGTAPRLPSQPQEHAAHAASGSPADPATPADVANTILAMWRWPSMTGQLIRLGR